MHTSDLNLRFVDAGTPGSTRWGLLWSFIKHSLNFMPLQIQGGPFKKPQCLESANLP